MKFLVDAQLPRRMVAWMREQGHDALHTLDLPEGNRTTDAEIIALAVQHGRVVVTKDADFIESFLVHQQPDKLLVIATGNISNTELERLLVPHLPAIASAFESSDFIEVTRFGVMIHS